jgi:cell wall-associated NlpC family hydrolase
MNTPNKVKNHMVSLHKPLVNLILLCSLAISLSGCGSSRNVGHRNANVPAKNIGLTKKESLLIDQAKSFIGTPYQWGGDSKHAIDIDVPRTTQELIHQGRKIAPSKLKPGDLVFFKTLKSKAKATHVGLVTQRTKNETLFIHSGTKSGVTISKLGDTYWKKHFVFARRIW